MKTMIALTLFASITAPAMAETFTRDGATYRYEVKDSGNYKLITGQNLSTGQAFELRVRNGRVSGNYAGQAVSFRSDNKPSQLASR